ncbi:MAG TPA: hypothetical protein VLA55_07100 [Ornithinibacter sp.]|nr:hypothetical protein [Ornithinibacter sp.]
MCSLVGPTGVLADGEQPNGAPDAPGAPGAPGVPDVPPHDVPDVPSPDVPDVPEVPQVPDVPDVPGVPPHEVPALGAPARGALEHAGLTTWDAVAATSDRDLLRLHGFGPKALRILREVPVPPASGSW